MRIKTQKEITAFSNYPQIGGLELLHAVYTKHTFSPHFHEGHVIGVIENGNLGFDYKGEKLVATKGEINIADPGEVHNGFSVSKQGWEYRMFYLKPGHLDRICDEIVDKKQPMPFFNLGVIKDEWFATRLLQLHAYFSNPGISLLEKESRFYALIAKFLMKHAKTSIVPVESGSERQAVSRAKQYMEAHYESNISLSDLSRVVELSRYYFLRVFKKETGLTPHAYLNQIRVNKVKKLINSKKSIIETAYATGFFDQSHLNRIFKKIYGITPGQYSKTLSVQY